MHTFLHTLPLPLRYRHYLSGVRQILFTRPQSVSTPISPQRICASLSEAHSLGKANCDCMTLAQNMGYPLTQGHIVARVPWSLHKLFGKQAPILLQNVNNEPAPSWNAVHDLAITSLRKLLCHILPDHLDLSIEGPNLYSAVLSELKSLWKSAIACTPWYLRSGPIKAFKQSAKRWLFLSCDKNSRRIMAMCPSLCYHSVYTFLFPPQTIFCTPGIPVAPCST